MMGPSLVCTLLVLSCIYPKGTPQDAERLAQLYPGQVSIVKYEEVARKPKTTLPVILKVIQLYIVRSDIS